MGFASGLNKNIDKVLNQVNDSILNTAVDFGGGLMKYSPPSGDAIFMGAYSTGLFINSWYVAENEFDETVGTSPDESGSASKARIEALKTSKMFVGKDGYISFTNNLPYAYRVSKLGWPQGRDEQSGWVWTGSVGPYAIIENATTYVMGLNKQ